MSGRFAFSALSAFAISGAAVAATSVAGSWATSRSVRTPWYDCIRPSFAPPSVVFPIVWTALYLCLFVAFGTSLRFDSGVVQLLHVVNLALNVVWCWTYFGSKQVAVALAVLVANLIVAVAVAATTGSKLVAGLMIPYIVWLSFATALNAASVPKAAGC